MYFKGSYTFGQNKVVFEFSRRKVTQPYKNSFVIEFNTQVNVCLLMYEIKSKISLKIYTKYFINFYLYMS